MLLALTSTLHTRRAAPRLVDVDVDGVMWSHCVRLRALVVEGMHGADVGQGAPEASLCMVNLCAAWVWLRPTALQRGLAGKDVPAAGQECGSPVLKYPPLPVG